MGKRICKIKSTIMASLVISTLANPEMAFSRVFDDEAVGKAIHPFEDGSLDNYAQPHYNAYAVSLAINELVQHIEQRLGQVSTLTNASQVDNNTILQVRLLALNHAHNELIFLTAPGAIARDQPYIYVQKMLATFSDQMETLQAKLNNPMLLPIMAVTAYAYAEEMLFVLHKVSQLIRVGLYWHEHSFLLAKSLLHLKKINAHLLAHPQTIGLQPQSLTDLDDVLAHKLEEIREYGADRDVFRVLRVQVGQTLRKHRANNFLKGKGMSQDDFPKTKKDRMILDGRMNDEDYLNSFSGSSFEGRSGNHHDD